VNIPHIKYNLPSRWLWTTVGEIGVIASGGTPSTQNAEYWGDDIAWITPADLSNYRKKYIAKGARNITQAGLDYSAAKLLPKGSILFSSRAPIGYVAIAKNDLATNQGFKNLIPTKSLYSDYVYYYFKTIKPLAEGMASGTTFLELSAAKFSQIPFPLPPLNEQRRIVSKIEELFSELDYAEECLKKAQKQLEIYSQALYKSSFEHRENWNIYKVQYLFELVDGDRGKNYPKQSDYLDDGYCLFLSTKNVRLNYFLFEEKVFISKKKHEALRNGTLQRGNIVMTTRGTLGNVALYDETVPYPIVRINSGMVIMKSKNANNNLKYLSNYLISPFFKEQIKQKQTGTAQPQLPLNILKDFEIAIPFKKEQDKIILELETKISLIKNLSNTIDIGLKKNEVLRSAILRKAFNGELVPQNLADEDARKLLQKILKEKEDYLNVQKEVQKKKPKGRLIMKNSKSIIEILKEANLPIEAEKLWLQSKHVNDIDAFYTELKKIEKKIDIKINRNKSLIGLKK